MRRTVPLALVSTLFASTAVLLGGCDSNIAQRGFAATPGTVEKLEAGTQSREDVVRLAFAAHPDEIGEGAGVEGDPGPVEMRNGVDAAFQHAAVMADHQHRSLVLRQQFLQQHGRHRAEE